MSELNFLQPQLQNEKPRLKHVMPEPDTKMEAGTGTQIYVTTLNDKSRVIVGGPLSLAFTETMDATSEAAPSRSKRSDWRVELKFVVDESIAIHVRDWATQHLEPDAHCAASSSEGYRVSSLYLDTPHWDVYHRTKPTGQRKFRLRRYGLEDVIWLETKRKSNGFGRKRRTSVPEVDAGRVLAPGDPDWVGAWFQRRVMLKQLRPVAAVTYQRFARVGSTTDGDIRLTIDRDLRGTAATDWAVPHGISGEIPLLPQGYVVELKFRDVLPSPFKQLLTSIPLQATSFSKYRAAVDACGLRPTQTPVAS